MPKNVLVVAAHPDDEALGAGGIIARHARAGDVVSCVFMTNGVSARGEGLQEEARQRNEAAEEAASVLGISKTVYHDFSDNAMDSVPLIEIVKAVEAAINEARPEVVYTHFGQDLNVDHRLTYEAVLTACRPQKGHPVREIYSFEVPSSTEWSSDDIGPAFQPDVFVDITDFFDVKMKALEAYAAEMRDAPHPRSVEGVTALASWRGQTSGCNYAEGLKTVRVLS